MHQLFSRKISCTHVRVWFLRLHTNTHNTHTHTHTHIRAHTCTNTHQDTSCTNYSRETDPRTHVHECLVPETTHTHTNTHTTHTHMHMHTHTHTCTHTHHTHTTFSQTCTHTHLCLVLRAMASSYKWTLALYEESENSYTSYAKLLCLLYCPTRV